MRHLGKQFAPALLVVAELSSISGNVVLVDLLHDAGGVNLAPAAVSAVVGPTSSHNHPILTCDMTTADDSIRVAAIARSRPRDPHRDQRQRCKDGLKNRAKSAGEPVALAPFTTK